MNTLRTLFLDVLKCQDQVLEGLQELARVSVTNRTLDMGEIEAQFHKLAKMGNAASACDRVHLMREALENCMVNCHLDGVFHLNFGDETESWQPGATNCCLGRSSQG
ncbi:unnamed protein product [Choristocarpus tenellus]